MAYASLLAVALISCGRVGFETEAIPDAQSLVQPCGCGDADGNGTADFADVTVVAQQLAGLGALVCPGGADANADGEITVRDLNALVFGITGVASRVCNACPAVACGDLTGDGQVNGDDNLALDAMLTTPNAGHDACVAWAADVTGDGQLDDADLMALEAKTLACAP